MIVVEQLVPENLYSTGKTFEENMMNDIPCAIILDINAGLSWVSERRSWSQKMIYENGVYDVTQDVISKSKVEGISYTEAFIMLAHKLHETGSL